MKTEIFFHSLNLQLFAEGTGGDGGTGANGATGVTEAVAVPQKGVKNPLADVKYGIQEETPPAAKVEQTATEDRNAKFDALIKGEFKDLYDAKVQDTIQKRLKSTKETVDKYNELTPTLEILAKKYGVDATDVKALNKAIEEDDSYFEEEALEKGLSVEQLKEIRKMERENSELKRQMEERQRKENADRIYSQWMDQAEKAKAVYPSFDLRTEMQNPQFINLLNSNVDVRTAYEVLHKDEIIPAAMHFTAKTVEQKLTNKIIAQGARPAENGNSSQSASVVKSDVSQLSKADRAEIIRRVQRGEKIRF
jgi:hypothetical protein